MPDWGYIYYRCPECGRKNRILVTFPAFNKPFKTRTHECLCGATNEVYDPHKFNEDGTIIDEDLSDVEDAAEVHERFVEDYENRPDVQAGWAQQDLIDSYRRER